MEDFFQLFKNNKIRSTLINILISSIIFFIFIGILEIILCNTYTFTTNPWLKLDPILGRRLVPGCKYRYMRENDHPVTVTINSYGWRDKEWSLKKPKNTYRIAVLGDSMVQSEDIESDRTFLSLAEQQFNEDAQHLKIELMNFGQSNISQAEELLILKNDVMQFLPDMVLLFFFPTNDIYDVAKNTTLNVSRPFYHVSEKGELLLDTRFSETREYKIRCVLNFFKQHSTLIAFISERYFGYVQQRKIRAKNLSTAEGTGILPKYLSLCTTNPCETLFKNYQLNKMLIKAMSEYCKEKSIQFMLVTVDMPTIYIPENEKKYKTIDPSFNANFFEDDLRNYAASLNIEYLGLQRIFKIVYENTGVPLHWAHWNYHGHRVVANALVNKLKSISIINSN